MRYIKIAIIVFILICQVYEQNYLQNIRSKPLQRFLQANNQAPGEDNVSNESVASILDFLAYSLHRSELGNNPKERIENALILFFEKQPGLQKYVPPLQYKAGNEEMVLLVDETNKKQYIAIRGTDLLKKFVRDMISNTLIFLDLLPYRGKKAKKFIEENALELHNLGYKTIVTGHSLGGTASMMQCGFIDWIDECHAYNPGTSFCKNALCVGATIVAKNLLMLSPQRVIAKYAIKAINTYAISYLIDSVKKNKVNEENFKKIYVESSERDLVSKFGYIFKGQEDQINKEIQQQSESAIYCEHNHHTVLNQIAQFPEFNREECLKDFFSLDDENSISKEIELQVMREIIQDIEITFNRIQVKSDCPQGHYLGKESCIPCDNNIVEECQQGTYLPTCKNKENKDALFYFDIQSSKCKSCEEGFYYVGQQENCIQCPFNTNVQGKGICTPNKCLDNEYYHRGKCYQCEKGYECDGQNRLKCQQGYQATGHSCDKCAINQYGAFDRVKGKFQCYPCPKGHECDGTRYQHCSQGTQEINSQCEPCLDIEYGIYSTQERMHICLKCPIGYECDGKSKIPCQQGYHGIDGECIPCHINEYGIYSVNQKMSVCKECPEGYKCDGKNRQKCTQGFYGQNGQCVKCEQNQYGLKNEEKNIYECIYCKDGHRCDGKEIFPCNQGEYGIDGKCIPCDSNQYGIQENNIFVCQDCPPEYTCNGVWKQKNVNTTLDQNGCSQGQQYMNNVCANCSQNQFGQLSRYGQFECQNCYGGGECNGISFRLCEQGKDGRNGICHYCADNQYGYYSQNRYYCENCGWGEKCNGKQRSRCPQGTYGIDGRCKNCMNHQFGDYDFQFGRHQCKDCGYWQKCDGVTNSICSQGSQSVNGQCFKCTIQQYAQYVSNYGYYKCSFDNCLPNYKCNGAVGYPCPQGTYGTNGECFPCELQQYSYFSDNKYQCQYCQIGYECDGMTKKLCNQGYRGIGGICYKCNDYEYGFYDFLKNIYGCRICPVGYECNGTIRELCKNGFYGINGKCIPCEKYQYGYYDVLKKFYKCGHCLDGHKCNGTYIKKCENGQKGLNGKCKDI